MTISPARGSSSNWILVTGLLVLCLVPTAAGIYRLTQLASGVVTVENQRFFAAPLPIIVHVFCVAAFCILGAFQFVPSLRFRTPWHRMTGKFLVPLGLISAFTGLWMNQFNDLPASDGTILYLERVVFGLLMFVSLVLGYLAIRKPNYPAHRAWMMRGYAIGLGAGTQVLTHLPWFILVGTTPSVFPRAILMGSGWVINLAVAEWFIRRNSVMAVRV